MSTVNESVAIVGLNGRFPGADNVDQFWRNLAEGTESITFLTDDELKEAGVSPLLLSKSKYVKAASLIGQIDQFDASFFGMTPREAEILDPQQRLFLECCWEVLELAGYAPEKFDGRIGVYGGAFMSTYMLNVYSNPHIVEAVGDLSVRHANDKDYLATRVSYKFNLRGPSITVQTSCSTSLVAVHLAIQSLLSGECDMAIAGGVSVTVPQAAGYLYQEGGILTPDGHCRPFDANAKGTIFGNGIGVAALKRLEDALADGDYIYAVIKGSAINNDGADKVGYTAPSVSGQAEAIADAMAMADVQPSTIGMVEAHGTGTPLGDPIEISALTQVYRAETEENQFCAIGSVKSNVGHLGAASGITGLIKAALSLHYRQIPPSLHFEEPNPNIDFASSPFYVNTTLKEWPAKQSFPRRAAVSSFGMGGTNAHVVLEEAPADARQPEGLPHSEQLLVLSAQSDTALSQAEERLKDYLEHNREVSLHDVAFTLQAGRREFRHRSILTARTSEEAADILAESTGRKLVRGQAMPGKRRVAFLFPGQGSQHIGMAQDLYESEPVFRSVFDLCCTLLQPEIGVDLRQLLFESNGAEEAEKRLQQTALAQPALFAVEYSLAKLLASFGIHPDIMLGHSIGEYTAACIAGVFSLEDALRIVAARGRLMQQMQEGSMLSVAISEAGIKPYLDKGLSLAAINAVDRCVVSGPALQIAVLMSRLQAGRIDARLLRTSHAFHSSMMDPMLDEFQQLIAAINKNAPSIPYLSNVTGDVIKPEEAIDSRYWAVQLRNTVRFHDGASRLLDEAAIVLEVGPGQTLTALLQQLTNSLTGSSTAIPLMRHPKDRQSDRTVMLQAIGRMWSEGAEVHWNGLHSAGSPRRIPLPTYPFERKRYWIERKGNIWDESIDAPTDSDQTAGQVADKSEKPVDHATLSARSDAEAAAAIAAEAANVTGQEPELFRAANNPVESVEQTITVIWQELFGISTIGQDDNFFELGGNSLLAIQLVSRIREQFDVELNIEELFDDPTIVGLTAQVTAAKAAQNAEDTAANGADDELERIMQELEGHSLDTIQKELDKLKA